MFLSYSFPLFSFHIDCSLVVMMGCPLGGFLFTNLFSTKRDVLKMGLLKGVAVKRTVSKKRYAEA